MRLYPASRLAINYSLQKFHYAKTIVNPQIAFSVFNDKDQFCGVICYGVSGCPYLGNKFGLAPGRWIELQRVALNGLQEKTSKALAISIKLLKKYKPCVKLIISYADIQQKHTGIIYKATNWYYLGRSARNVKKYFDPVRGRYVHQRGIIKNKKYKISKTLGKHKYVYPLNKELEQFINKLSKPYPASIV